MKAVSGPTLFVFPESVFRYMNAIGFDTPWRGYALAYVHREGTEIRSAPNTYRRSRNSRRGTSSVPAARICRRRLSQTRRSEPQLRRQVGDGATPRAEPRNRSNHTHVCHGISLPQERDQGARSIKSEDSRTAAGTAKDVFGPGHGGVRRSSRRRDPPRKASGA